MWPACLAYLAETCICVGDPDVAAGLVTELGPFSGTKLPRPHRHPSNHRTAMRCGVWMT